MTLTTTPRIPAEQKFWVVIHWFAVLQPLYLVLVAVANRAAATNILVLVIAIVATIIVAIFATLLARRRPTNQVFVKGTTTGRTIAVGWTFIGIALVVVPVVAAVLEFEVGNSDWTGGLIGAVGSVSFLAAIGPGYSDFREALAQQKEPVAA